MLIEDTPYPLSTQKVVLSNGLTLAYADVGKGYPLLFIHGLGSYLPAWEKNIAILSEHYRCLALDLPGYGKSTKTGFKAGMGFYAGLVKDFLDKLEIPACFLVGHSMGGQVGIHTALKFPEKVKKLVLLAPAGIETFSKAEASQIKGWFELEKVYLAGPEIIEQQLKANFHYFPGDAQSLLRDRLNYKSCDDYRHFCKAVADSVEAMLQEPVYEALPALSMPVLILFGRQDAYIPNRLLHPRLEFEAVLKDTTARMPQASYQLIDACSHFLQWEQAWRVNSYLLDFLGEQL